MPPTPLLPFQSTIISETHDPGSSDLLILARGLGLRRIICSLLKIYAVPNSLVLVIGASTADEESGIASQLSTMGVRNPGLRIVDYEMPKKDRQELYRKGGLISVTSRILVVDLLQGDLPPTLISGLLVLHAERVTPSSLEAFIVRLYREENTEGFLKAFSDQPEYFTTGMFPLQTIMRELHLRKVHIYPRFQENIQNDLQRRKADIVELHQKLNPTMLDIHDGIVQCMNATLSELKKSQKALDLDDLNIDNAYFRSFDAMVRRQLDPVWHKVGMKTKQLVGDLATLRRLLTYLLSYDPITFLSFLETIRASNEVPTSRGSKNIRPQMTSPWLMTDAADIIFSGARKRCYVQNAPAPIVIPVRDEIEDAWDVLDEIEGRTPAPRRDEPQNKEADGWKPWMPSGMKPILEELPKWRLLSNVLDEIEQTMISHPSPRFAPGSNVTLIMAADHQTCALIREFLSTKHLDPEAPGRPLLESRLRTYLFWKRGLLNADDSKFSKKAASSGKKGPIGATTKDTQLSEALKRKDAERAAARNNRRRVRGGAPAAGGDRQNKDDGEKVASALDLDPDDLAEFYATQPDLAVIDSTTDLTFPLPPEAYSTIEKEENSESGRIPQPAILAQEPDLFFSAIDTEEYESDYGILPAEQTVVVRPYGDDEDDMMLTELRPRWIILYDPNQDFIRRIEVYRSSTPGLALRLYLLLHQETSEEHRFLLSVRKEKEAFERLITERGKMYLLLDTPRSAAAGETTDRLLNVISSRNAGGQKSIVSGPPKILVDMREFRSSLPNILHKAKNQIIPLTLTVGDYILTPEICVERKSLPDLVQSFNSGRLHSQCELMSVHYKQPVLLIEFEENKSFSMETIVETTVVPSKKFGNTEQKNAQQSDSSTKIDAQSVQARLVLLTLHFPRLRIIWSSSPHATASIFAELKMNNHEPDSAKAVTIGNEDGAEAESGENTAAEELLRSLPGVGTKNYRYVMGKVGSIRELCEMDQAALEALLGVEPGQKCFEFLHKGLRNNNG